MHPISFVNKKIKNDYPIALYVWIHYQTEQKNTSLRLIKMNEH